MDLSARSNNQYTAAPAPSRPSYTAKASPPVAGAPDSSLEQWISEQKLDKYRLQITSLAGEIQDLAEMDESDVADLVTECAIPKLAARRLYKALNALGANVPPVPPN